MNISEIFGGKSISEAEKKAAIMNVISVMGADRVFDPRESVMLEAVRQRVGMSKEELANIIRNPQSVKFVRPSSETERRAQLVDMVYMMMADGEVKTSELEVVIGLGVALGFSPDRIRIVIENIILQAIRTKKPRNTIIVDQAWAQKG